MPYNSADSVSVEMRPSSLSGQLLDPQAWQPVLEKYAKAVNLAVSFVDKNGHCGTIINAKPTWTLVSAKVSSSTGDCGFSLASHTFCTCAADAMKNGDAVFVRDRVRLTHFAIPLALNEQPLGALLGGQVFDQYPDQSVLEHIAREAGLSPVDVWQVARLEHPVKRATLKVYADLLWVLGDMFLQARYQKLVEERRLAEMTRLRGDLQERVEELETFEAAVIGRELKMIELENQLETLKRQAKKPQS